MKLGKAGKIGIGWAILSISGIYAFVLSKQSIDRKRIESMKVRDRMRKANQGEYKPSERRFDV